jgi:hypothetical protein
MLRNVEQFQQWLFLLDNNALYLQRTVFIQQNIGWLKITVNHIAGMKIITVPKNRYDEGE